MNNTPAKADQGRYGLGYRGTECLNCGHPLDLSDKFCSNCSQANSTKKLSIKDFLDEFFASFISYDSKLLKTLSSLLLKPGKITRDYINGKRVSYTNPFRFLLSLAIVYFLILGITGDFEQIDFFPTQEKASTFDLRATIDTLEYSNQKEKEQMMAVADSLNFANFVLRYGKHRDSALNANPRSYYETLKDESGLSRFFKKQDFFQTLFQNGSIRTFDDAISKYGIENTSENKFAFTSGKSFARIKERPGDFIKTMVSRLPFAVFFFVPVFALFIWLAYIRKRYNYTDHLIFSFHITSLLFILLIISYLVDTILRVSSNWLFLTIFSVYLFQALRKFYGQNVFKTIVKYLFLNTIFFILALVSTILMIAGNIITY